MFWLEYANSEVTVEQIRHLFFETKNHLCYCLKSRQEITIRSESEAFKTAISRQSGGYVYFKHVKV